MNTSLTNFIQHRSIAPSLAKGFALFVYFTAQEGGYLAHAVAQDKLSSATRVVGQWFVAEQDLAQVIADLSASGIGYALAHEEQENESIALPSPYFHAVIPVLENELVSSAPILLSLFDIHFTKAIPRGPNR
jgi:hypothetical protein